MDSQPDGVDYLPQRLANRNRYPESLWTLCGLVLLTCLVKILYRVPEVFDILVSISAHFVNVVLTILKSPGLAKSDCNHVVSAERVKSVPKHVVDGNGGAYCFAIVSLCLAIDRGGGSQITKCAWIVQMAEDEQLDLCWEAFKGCAIVTSLHLGAQRVIC